MNLQTLGLTGASALATNGSALTLRSPAAVNGRNLFRRVFGLRINTGGVADRVRFDAAAAHMAITFEPDTYDIRDSGHAALSSKGSKAVVVALPAPMQLRGARFENSVGPGTIELYRMDGDEITADHTKSIANGGNVSGDFTDSRFALKLIKSNGSQASIAPANLLDLNVKGFPTAARIGFVPHGQDPSSAFFFHIVAGEVGRNADSPSGSADIGQALANALQQHIDSLEAPFPAQLDFVLVAESDAPCVLRVSSFHIPFGLVRTALRAVLLRADDLLNAAAFCTRLRDASAPLTAYLRSKLSQSTRNAIDRNDGRDVPQPVLEAVASNLNVALQAEAFYTPARFQGITLTPATLALATAGTTGITRTRLNRTLLAEAFPDEVAPIIPPAASDKEVLQANGATSSITVLVDLPRGAAIRSATLRLEADLKGDAPAATASGDGSSGTAQNWDAPIPGVTGLVADSGRAIARRIEPDTAVDASAIALALSSTSAQAELVAEIREDQSGSPAGRALATASVTIAQLDRPAWVQFPFRTPVIIPAVPHWIVLRATNGSALWLAAEEAATTRVGAPLPKGWSDNSGFDSIAPLHHLWTRAAGSVNAGGNGADPGSRLRVQIGATTVLPLPGTGRVCAFNIAAAVQSALAVLPGSPPLVALPIRVSALGKGSVTIHPPEIEYDV